MKAILFICLSFVFYSCGVDIDLTGGFSIPGFYYTGDSTAKVKADISGPTTQHLSATAFGTTFSRYKWSVDSTVINIGGRDSLCSVQMQLTNIIIPGTYNFGTVTQSKRDASITCIFRNDFYVNDKNALSGTLLIDTITEHHIHGTFNVNCFKGTQQLTISNGSFVGNY